MLGGCGVGLSSSSGVGRDGGNLGDGSGGAGGGNSLGIISGWGCCGS